MVKQQPYTFGIVGFGIAGQLLALELITRGVMPSNVCICDETMLGGSLSTLYGSVVSNTPWSKTRKALEAYTPHNIQALREGDALYQETQCMPVRDIAKYCLMTAKAAISSVDQYITSIQSVQQDQSGVWKLSHTFGTISSKILFLAQGVRPKCLDLPYPTIPLPIALDKEQLKHHVDPTDTVTLFGTSHSGTHIIHHLHTLGIPTNAIYKTTTPFRFARDGEFDGVKEATETIADSILRGDYTSTRLVPWSDPLAVHRALCKTTKCIYSIGFQPTILQGASSAYDPNTAAIQTMPNTYGFGIAYPEVCTIQEKQYTSVSVLSFQNQICKCLPAILEKEKE
jgi:hypothetical protein